ncbi:hypothetical protein E3U55_06455 [Filobacillus milosensis]|uniref:DUF2929 family protein n=1 Tax=Filobacillus milosensis TaxID=94137 RepID=A0A4Y8IQD0_9BACI|nr:hypothetical protein [Filobacillus milosensis]TFB22876.1 hypothetical protein E3U55_06455 [Filobacillus milosensis]
MSARIIAAVIFGGLSGLILNLVVSSLGADHTNPATITMLGIIAGLIIVLIMEVNDWRYQNKGGNTGD